MRMTTLSLDIVDYMKTHTLFLLKTGDVCRLLQFCFVLDDNGDKYFSAASWILIWNCCSFSFYSVYEHNFDEIFRWKSNFIPQKQVQPWYFDFSMYSYGRVLCCLSCYDVKIQIFRIKQWTHSPIPGILAVGTLLQCSQTKMINILLSKQWI